MTLDDRLARDAARWREDDQAPDLDRMLTAAIAPRHRGAIWLPLAAAALVIAVVATVLALRSGHDGADTGQPAGPVVPVQFPSPRSIEKGGHTYTAQLVDPNGVVPVGSRRLRVFVADEYGSGDNPLCNQLDPSVRIAKQTATSVYLATFAYRSPPVTGGPRDVMCAFTEAEGGDLSELPAVALSEPLGGRVLRDASNGRVIARFGRRTVAPEPTYVPAGYRRIEVWPLTVGSPESPATTVYRGPSGATIEIDLESANAASMDGDIVNHVDIGPYEGTITSEKYERCVRWTAGAGHALSVCSLGESKHFLSDDELVKIANSIPR